MPISSSCRTFSSLLTSSASHFCFSSSSFCLIPPIPTSTWGLPLLHSHFLSSFVLQFLSSHPLSTSSSPPYLTGCHSNLMCRRVSGVYLLFLSSPRLDEYCCRVMCARGVDERRKRREGSFQFTETEGQQPPSFCLVFYSFFLFILQLNPSLCPFLSHSLPPIKPLHGVCPCR